MSDPESDIEKADTIQVSASPTPRSHKHHLRGRHFLSHEGRHIHVGSSPQEIETLKKQLSNTEDPFDLYLHGSPEHLDALRKTHNHHEQTREQLRQKHGELYEQFQRVHSELDWLAAELDHVTTQGVRLDASFSKYGYSAHLRSYEDEKDSAPMSGRSSMSDEERSSHDYKSPLKFFKAPVVRQYFHKGLIWRASEQQEVESFELFVDLLYVGIIAINGDYASEEPTGLSLLRFVITMTMSYKIWSDMTLMISWFEVNDMSRRLSILFTLACLFGFTTNITSAFEETYAQLVGYYLTARFFTALYMLYIAFLVPMVRPVLLVNVLSIAISSSLWIGSIHTHWPNQLALIFVAIAVDLISQTVHLFFVWTLSALTRKTREWAARTFEFFPALNIEHKIERTNAFVSLVFGYSVVALIYQNSSSFGLNAFFGKAILGLVQAFCFNWLYFEIDAANISMHAIRRHKFSAFVWLNSHLPFIMAFILAGGALARLVVAHDCDDASLEDLADTYQARSSGEIDTGVRWFYCAGLGVALASMGKRLAPPSSSELADPSFSLGVIALSHIHKSTPGLRLSKGWRIAIRFAVALILVLLPLASHLNSIKLVSITTSLIVFVLGNELWCASCCHDRLWDKSKCCGYVSQCGKKDAERIARKLDGEGEGESDGDTLFDGKKNDGATVM